MSSRTKLKKDNYIDEYSVEIAPKLKEQIVNKRFKSTEKIL